VERKDIFVELALQHEREAHGAGHLCERQPIARRLVANLLRPGPMPETLGGLRTHRGNPLQHLATPLGAEDHLVAVEIGGSGC
jgi:hypothetical protein